MKVPTKSELYNTIVELQKENATMISMIKKLRKENGFDNPESFPNALSTDLLKIQKSLDEQQINQHDAALTHIVELQIDLAQTQKELDEHCEIQRDMEQKNVENENKIYSLSEEVEVLKDKVAYLEKASEEKEKIIEAAHEVFDHKNINLFPCVDCKLAYSVNSLPSTCNNVCAFKTIYDIVDSIYKNS